MTLNKDPTQKLCHFLEMMLIPQSEYSKLFAKECLDSIKESVENGVYPNLDIVLISLQKLVGDNGE